LHRRDDSIGQSIINSVEEYLKTKGITIMANSLKGTNRRGVSFDVETGYINLTIGDGMEKVFWAFKK
jgi:chemotaxis receptor (MCP) glutamine deamidase CheD